MTKPIEFELERVKLNSQGYESRNGQYYGVGAPLYRATGEQESEWAQGIYTDVIEEFRARNRKDAKDMLRDKYPNCRFPR